MRLFIFIINYLYIFFSSFSPYLAYYFINIIFFIFIFSSIYFLLYNIISKLFYHY